MRKLGIVPARAMSSSSVSPTPRKSASWRRAAPESFGVLTSGLQEFRLHWGCSTSYVQLFHELAGAKRLPYPRVDRVAQPRPRSI